VRIEPLLLEYSVVLAIEYTSTRVTPEVSSC